MKRLLRKASEEEMSFEELKEVALTSIDNMKKNVNNWSVRDVLKDMTSWGFYQGGEKLIVDVNTAADICDQLKDYVNSLYSNNISGLEEVLSKVKHFYYF